ncbi:MAG: hypothetical protein ACI4UV_02615 [Victivallales bacterium]
MELKYDAGKIIFERNGGGMPDQLVLNDSPTGQSILSGRLEIILEDGRSIHPGTGACEPVHAKNDGVESLEFTDLNWFDTQGNRIPDFHLSLQHELYSDGAFFTTAMLHVETSTPPAIRHFQLSLTLRLEDFEKIRGAVLPRRGLYASADIQSAALRQILETGENCLLPQNQMASAGFYATRREGAALYGEFFLEGGGTLSGKPEDGHSEVVWHSKSPTVSWCFQNKHAATPRRPWQWRNRWGWVIAPPAAWRRLPPQVIYQYIDNYRHYPDTIELESIANAGCQALILHSNWRRDAKNGGVPYQLQRFREIVNYAHSRGIRVAVYVRGNEKEIQEEAAAWFGHCLLYDFDGLYIDYGSPLCLNEPPNEDFPAGTVCFYRHYRNLRRLRRRVGKHGIIISHTGADFSALGLSLADGYISGEAERGLLIRNRYEHEYFTMAGAAVGTLWSAAFPEYSTSAIIPFLAATGQAPHSPLGVQFKSSSLQHPPEPGINDSAFRPLWRLWGLFAEESDITIFNDYNSCGIFIPEPERGHYLMISRDRKRALLIVSNFGSGCGKFSIKWEKTGFDPSGKHCWRLRPSLQSPGSADSWEKEWLEADFQEYPAMAFFWSTESDELRKYSACYHQCGVRGKEYLEKVAGQRQLRSVGRNSGNPVFRVVLDNSICTSLEDSNYFDLFDNRLELVILQDNGKIKKVGEIGKTSFYPDGGCPKEDQLLPGDISPALPLHALLPPGKYRLGIRSIHQGEPFYSLISVQLKNSDHDTCWRQLDFYNDLEPDRSLLTWECEICQT